MAPLEADSIEGIVKTVEDLGGKFQLNGTVLNLEKPEGFPDNLVMLLRTHHPQIYQYVLSNHPDFAREGLKGLQSRLAKGHKYLTAIMQRWHATGDLSVDDENALLDGIDLWDNLDKALRGVYGYVGCCLGAGQSCPDESPVSCRACGEKKSSPPPVPMPRTTWTTPKD